MFIGANHVTLYVYSIASLLPAARSEMKLTVSQAESRSNALAPTTITPRTWLRFRANHSPSSMSMGINTNKLKTLILLFVFLFHLKFVTLDFSIRLNIVTMPRPATPR